MKRCLESGGPRGSELDVYSDDREEGDVEEGKRGRYPYRIRQYLPTSTYLLGIYSTSSVNVKN